MMPLLSILPILCLLLCAVPARAAEVIFSCDVVQNRSRVGAPEVITLDTDTHSISHLKQIWSDGQVSRLVATLEQFVRITETRFTWGHRRTTDGIINDLFSIDRATGAYTWVDSRGQEIAHGACHGPALTS